MNSNFCRVCGFYINDKPWGEDGHTPTYEICPCCGVEFGNEDYSLESIHRYRTEWINNGCQWFDISQRPSDWNKHVQFENIGAQFR